GASCVACSWLGRWRRAPRRGCWTSPPADWTCATSWPSWTCCARRLAPAVLAVLHDLTLAALECDRVLVMREGAVAASGPPATVLDHALLASVSGVNV